jgi:DSF synthase
MAGSGETNVQSEQISNLPLCDLIKNITGPLPQIELEYDASASLLWIDLRPEPKPVFTLNLIESVRKVQDAIGGPLAARGLAPRFLAYRSSGAFFSMGGDIDFYLDCLASADRAGLAAYSRLAAEVVWNNMSGLDGRVVTLATVAGKALGGGIDPARACNVMIAEEGATFCYPEINYNHFPITATSVLCRRVPVLVAQDILMSGETYSAQEFAELEVLDAAVPAGTGEGWIRDFALRNAPRQRAMAGLFGALTRETGDWRRNLMTAAEAWVDHMLGLRPIEISRLQRIAHAQERILARQSPQPSIWTGTPAAESC